MAMGKTKYDFGKLEEFVKESLKNDKTGHDYEHTKRVLRNALKIAKNYPNADVDVLTAGCLLHDIAFKDGFVKEHHIVGAKQAERILKEFGFPQENISRIKIIIEDHVGNVAKPLRENFQLSIESKILRDADNINALGEIGLKRMIAFCNSRNMPKFVSKKDGFNDSLYGGIKGLISWPDKMLTPEGKKLGKSKVKIMEAYMKTLEAEAK
jgi:uncharacterized protein